MKRLWLAGALFAFAVGLCALSLGYQHRQVTALLEDLTRLETVYREQGAVAARPLAEDFAAEYTHRTRLFPYYISHSDLIDGQECAAVLPVVLAGEASEEFPMEAARCRTQLKKLLALETPTPENVF